MDIKETLFRNPGSIFFGTLAIVSLVWALLPSLWPSDNALDLNLHDTYLVIGTKYMLMLTAISSAIIASIYILIKYDRNHITIRFLTLSHITASLLGLFGFILLSAISNPSFTRSAGPKYVTYVDSIEMDSSVNLMPLTLILIIVGVIGQLLFIINLLINLVKRISRL